MECRADIYELAQVPEGMLHWHGFLPGLTHPVVNAAMLLPTPELVHFEFAYMCLWHCADIR